MKIGVDLGGTKITAVVLNQLGEELERIRVDTPAEQGAEAIVEAIGQCVHALEQRIGQQASVGIGTPGAISRKTGLLKNSNTVCLNGRPLLGMLERALQRPLRLANDANCFALSEAIDGAGQGSSVVFGVIVGTGTGAGVVVAGEPLQGCNAISGEWGHNPLPWPVDGELASTRCYCGRQGCIETFLSGPGLSRDYVRLGGEALPAWQIAERADRGEALAETCLQRYEERMARGLAHVINILDPDVIVLGGGLSKMQRLYTNVPALWGQYVFSDEVLTELKPPVHGDDGGVRGAAWLWGRPSA